MAADTSKYKKIKEAFKNAVRKIYEEAATTGEWLPIADEKGKVIYIDPKTVLNK
jgi:hypothetical protein